MYRGWLVGPCGFPAVMFYLYLASVQSGLLIPQLDACHAESNSKQLPTGEALFLAAEHKKHILASRTG